MRAGTVDEDKGVATRQRLAQFRCDDAAQGIEALAHVRLFTIEMIAAQLRQVQETTHEISSLRYEALTG